MAQPEIPVERVFHAMGDPTRRAIVELLAQGPLSVSALAAPLGVTLTAISQHLQILEEAGLAATQKIGRVRTCRLETRGLDVLQSWIAERRPLWDKRLDALGSVLGESG